MDLSIIIVNYNTKQLTLNCVASVLESETEYTYEIILVDNASKDDTVVAVKQQYPCVHLIENKDNLGFSKANNQGMHVAKGRYVLLLNSDTIVQPDTFDIMIRFMDENPKVGSAGCKVVLPDGSLDKACKRGFPTPAATFYYVSGISKRYPNSPKYNAYHRGDLDENGSYPIDCLVGAFMMVRREAIEQVGMLDEDYFMYGEDVDWCYRIQQAGWVNYYHAATSILHLKRASSRNKPYKITYEFHRAIYLLHKKNFAKYYPWWVNAFMYTGIVVKTAVALALNTCFKAKALFTNKK
ncbi:glycosyltransferase family 2 protein [Paenibacillus agilis]|uniref:Glycosyltransferase family 2 protein n=1 Tax=Paenibacillus agilis TaxID=3020863 RepID=A0A559IP31_9BACL|nr:glycosyltransferase family 2 protein [Paenibacillus agilis]TVX89397.1 glycosyltransferase family 2 protein [Paenibacillus agilis]